MVEVRGLEPPVSWSRTRRDASFATPRNESGRNRTGVVLLKRELPGQRGRRTRMVGRPGFEPGVSGLRVRRLSLDACDPNGVAGSRGIEPLFSDRQSDGLPLAYDPRWIAPRLVAAAQAGSGVLRAARSGTWGGYLESNQRPAGSQPAALPLRHTHHTKACPAGIEPASQLSESWVLPLNDGHIGARSMLDAPVHHNCIRDVTDR